MSRVYSFFHDGAHIHLANPFDVSETDNIFTVVVGKNGVGKSRLLSAIANSQIEEMHFRLDHGEYPEDFHHRDYSLSKVIAVSTSPFDKFPIARRRAGSEIVTNYRYVGMKGEGLYQPSSAVSLISSAAKGLLDKLLSGTANHNFLSVFDSLSFLPVVDFVFKPGYIGPRKREYDLYSIGDTSLRIDLECLNRERDIQIDSRYFEMLERSSVSRRHKIFAAVVKVNELLTHRKAVELTVDFRSGAAYLDGVGASESYIEAMLLLMNYGLMRLMDLRLQKIGYGDLSLKKASSGEQCLLVLMLGIAGHITDNSLVLIDEPEISLHPRWQEEFMLLLTSSFSAYKACHFIVATHSPQIISRLKERGCFISSLSKGKLFKAHEFHHRSADYQLAELFDAPGLMNEYISRLAFNLLAKVKARDGLDKEALIDLARLNELDLQVENDDPVKELISSVVQMCDYYADR